MIFVPMILVLLLAAFAQGALPAIGWLGMAKAPLILSAVIYYALCHGRGAMLVGAFLGGLLQDSLGFIPLGSSTLCFCLAGLLIQAVREFLFRDSLLTAVSLSALSAGVITLVTFLFLTTGDGDGPTLGIPVWAVWLKAAGALLLAVVWAPFVCLVARGLDRLLGTLEEVPAA